MASSIAASSASNSLEPTQQVRCEAPYRAALVSASPVSSRSPPRYSGTPRGIGRQLEAAAGLQRLDLRGEAQHAPRFSEIERPDAEGVAGGEQAAPRLVPDGEGEHAAKPRDHLGPIAGIEQQQHLGIGGR